MNRWMNKTVLSSSFGLLMREVAPRTGRALGWLASKQEHVRRLLLVPPQWGRTIGGPGICCKSSYFWTFWVELWMKCFIGFAKVLFEALIFMQNFWDWCLCQDALIYIDISDPRNHVLSWAKRVWKAFNFWSCSWSGSVMRTFAHPADNVAYQIQFFPPITF